MKSWGQSLRDAWWSGTWASLVSTAVLALRGRRETGSAVAATNAISHWYWGEDAKRHDELSLRHTAFGYATHHIASVFWATFYERWFGERAARDPGAALGGGAVIAAVACVVDYRFTPHRLQPGYEDRLSTRSLVGVYAAIAVGLAIASLARPGPRQPATVALPWRAHTRRVHQVNRFARRSVRLRPTRLAP